MGLANLILPQRGRGTTAGGGGARASTLGVSGLLPCPSTMLRMVPLPVPGRIV
jgi:hypothetical protein